jgi:hypothetical protein
MLYNETFTCSCAALLKLRRQSLRQVRSLSIVLPALQSIVLGVASVRPLDMTSFADMISHAGLFQRISSYFIVFPCISQLWSAKTIAVPDSIITIHVPYVSRIQRDSQPAQLTWKHSWSAGCFLVTDRHCFGWTIHLFDVVVSDLWCVFKAFFFMEKGN